MIANLRKFTQRATSILASHSKDGNFFSVGKTSLTPATPYTVSLGNITMEFDAAGAKFLVESLLAYLIKDGVETNASLLTPLEGSGHQRLSSRAYIVLSTDNCRKLLEAVDANRQLCGIAEGAPDATSFDGLGLHRIDGGDSLQISSADLMQLARFKIEELAEANAG